MIPTTTDRLLTPAEVSALFGKPEVALAKMRMNGTGPRFIKIGRAVRYRESEIDRFLAEQTFEQTEGTGR